MFDQLSSSLVPHVRVEGDIHVPQSCPLIPTCQLRRVYALIHIHTIIKFNSKTMKFHCVSLVTTNRIEHSFYWWISSPENFLCPLPTWIKQVFFRFIYLCVYFACMYAYMCTWCPTEVRRWQIHWSKLQMVVSCCGGTWTCARKGSSQPLRHQLNNFI